MNVFNDVWFMALNRVQIVFVTCVWLIKYLLRNDGVGGRITTNILYVIVYMYKLKQMIFN